MDLRSPSFWRQRDGRGRAYPRLDRNLSCDVLVIGAGLTGAVIASELSRRGVECVLIDRREVAAGSTSASTALVLYELDQPLHRLQKRLGVEAAQCVYTLHRDAIGELKSMAASTGERIPWLDVPSLFLARSRSHVPMLEQELEARRKAGLDVSLVSPRELDSRFGLERPCGILSRDGAITDPYLLALALARHAEARGARVFAGTRVAGFERLRGRLLATTSRGHTVRARHVIHAGGFEALRLAPRGLATLRSTYAIATEPLPAEPSPHFAAWDSGGSYLYLRSTVDGRMIIGGADDDYAGPRARDAAIPRKARTLERALARLAPRHAPSRAFAWAGTFAETRDGFGYVDLHPRVPGVLLALACGGNGMTFAPIAARLAWAWVEGTAHPDAPHFRFDRGH